MAAIFGSAFTEVALQATAAGTSCARADLRVGLDVVLCESRGTALAAGLDAVADRVIGRGSELVRDEVDALGATIDVGGLDSARDTLGGRMPGAVLFLTGRVAWPVGTVGAEMDDSLLNLDSTRAGGARLYSQCTENAGSGGTYFQVAQEAGGTSLGSRPQHIRVTLLVPLLEEGCA